MNKLVCVRRKSDNYPFRMEKQAADAMMLDKPGEFAFTSKESTKAFYKRLAGTTSNEQFLKNVDFTTKQKDNFVVEENGKVIGYVLKGMKAVSWETPEDEQEAIKKRNWIENLIESACINPNDQTLKNNIVARLAVFFGLFKDFFNKKNKTPLPKSNSVDLPQFQRFVLGYGTADKMRMA